MDGLALDARLDLRAEPAQLTAYWFDESAPGAAVIDPATGQGMASADPSPTRRWLTNLHRSLFLGDAGRIAMAAGAAAMLVLGLSGAALVARRTGGWRRWFARLRGPLAGRIHVEIARVAVAGLVLSSATALWMAASTFDLLPDGEAAPAFPAAVSGETGAAPGGMDLLRRTPVAELRELAFPYAISTVLGAIGMSPNVTALDTPGFLHLGHVLPSDRRPWKSIEQAALGIDPLAYPERHWCSAHEVLQIVAALQARGHVLD